MNHALYIAGIIVIVVLEIVVQAGWLDPATNGKCDGDICIAPPPRPTHVPSN